ncbi:hypothetical protein BC835DRAFT_1311080 [Cytidiella melzeri]|nr:hypothetical protein BC835DRAFT_1311080 [Cytidiella melzeri]
MDLDNPAVDSALAIPAWLEAHVVPANCSVGKLLGRMARLPMVYHSSVLVSAKFNPFFWAHKMPASTKERFSRDQYLLLFISGHNCFLDWQHNHVPTLLFALAYWSQQARAIEEGMLWASAKEHVTSLTHHAADTETAQAATTALLTLKCLDWDVELQDPEVYANTKRFAQLRHLGTRLYHGDVDTVYLPAHVNGNHWTLFHVTKSTREISYGDSFGNPPPKRHTKAFQCWLEMHEPSLYGLGGTIPISSQPYDEGISCGITVINAINHALFGNPLWTSKTLNRLRLHEYLDIVDDHLNYCRQSWQQPTEHDNHVETDVHVHGHEPTLKPNTMLYCERAQRGTGEVTKGTELGEQRKEAKKIKDRDDAREWKQKSRAKTKKEEVASGVWDRVTGTILLLRHLMLEQK